LVDTQPTVGLSVRTTIDTQLQAILENSLKSAENVRKGAVVILDISSGDVIAAASVPDFDPNRFIPDLSARDWRNLIEERRNPLLNRFYQQRVPPGSTFKVITSLAAMRAGVLDPRRVVHCPGYFQVGNITFNFPNETQDVSYRTALARSCNTYFMDLGLRTGRNSLIETAREFGIGQSLGFLLPDESPGCMPDPKYVLAVHHRYMGAGDVANSSIGQGDVLITPLQAANLMATIANGGTLWRPRIVSQLEDSNGKIIKQFTPEVIRKIDMPPQIDLLRDALGAVVEEGTAMTAQVPGVNIAGKTGTAQVGSKSVPRQIAWFDGYLPAEKPRYAFAVMVEGDTDQDLHGGPTAGPIIAEVFAKYLSKSVLTASQ
jgi:penicillin-binding protein 2